MAVREKFDLLQDPHAGPMTMGFAYFMSKDLHDMKVERCVKRVAQYMYETINKMSFTSINVLHSFFAIYTICKRPCRRLGVRAKISVIIHNFEGLYLNADDSPPQDSDKTVRDDRKTKSETLTIQNLQNEIKTMTSLFLDDVQLTSKENRALNARLEPIIKQM